MKRWYNSKTENKYAYSTPDDSSIVKEWWIVHELSRGKHTSVHCTMFTNVEDKKHVHKFILNITTRPDLHRC